MLYRNSIIPYLLGIFWESTPLHWISQFTTLVKISSILLFLSQVKLFRRWILSPPLWICSFSPLSVFISEFLLSHHWALLLSSHLLRLIRGSLIVIIYESLVPIRKQIFLSKLKYLVPPQQWEWWWTILGYMQFFFAMKNHSLCLAHSVRLWSQIHHRIFQKKKSVHLEYSSHLKIVVRVPV